MREFASAPRPLSLQIVHEGRFGRVARVALSGANLYRLSLENALKIAAHVTERELIGLAMDWRDCDMTHNVTQLSEVAATFDSNLPGLVKFAVIHRPEQLAYAMHMTRSVSKTGRPARSFSQSADAIAWLELTNANSEFPS